MHVDLLSSTAKSGKGKEIHATDNGKRSACGINLTKVENIGAYTSIGEMTDITQITCEKCKTVIAKRMIKESNREMAALLKEERKREKLASKHHEDDAPVPQPSAPSSSRGGEYVPPSMRKAQQQPQKPIVAPPPEQPKPVSMPAPAPASQAAKADDVLAQFAIPQVPTSLPGARPSAPAPAPAPAPAAPPVDDVLAQFAIPQVPTSLPGVMPASAPAPAAPPVDDVLAQFAIPTVPTSLPGVTPAAAPAPAAPVPDDDVLAQFAIPTVPTSLPGVTPASAQVPPAAPVMPTARPLPADEDDVLAQFAIPAVPTSLPGVMPAASPAAPADSAEDLLAQLSQSAPAKPSVLDSLADSIFEGGVQQTVPDADVTPGFSAHIPSTDEIVEVDPIPAADGMDAYHVSAPVLPPVEDPDDIFVMPGTSGHAAPTLQPTVPTAPPVSHQAPTLNVPTTPPAAAPAAVTAAPSTVLPGVAAPTVPTAPAAQQVQQAPTLNVPQAPKVPYPQPAQPSPMTSVPAAAKKQEPSAPTPLFVGYGADGRQVFQTYDALGNPIPITEPVFSVPPQEANTPFINSASVHQSAPAGSPGGAPILDMDELMSKLGIEDPRKPKKDDGPAAHFTEYHVPPKKKSTGSKPAKKKPEDAGPISAAEAKRRKKLEKINKQFEKDLRARGLDPETGAFVGRGGKNN